MMKTNEKIKELREVNRWSQEEVAEKMQMSPSSYAKLEQGKTKITIDRLDQFSDLFDVEIAELIKKEGNTFYQKNEYNNSTGNMYNNASSSIQHELEKLQLTLAHKGQTIIEKNNEIQALKSAISSLRKIIELLEKGQ